MFVSLTKLKNTNDMHIFFIFASFSTCEHQTQKILQRNLTPFSWLLCPWSVNSRKSSYSTNLWNISVNSRNHVVKPFDAFEFRSSQLPSHLHRTRQSFRVICGPPQKRPHMILIGGCHNGSAGENFAGWWWFQVQQEILCCICRRQPKSLNWG